MSTHSSTKTSIQWIRFYTPLLFPWAKLSLKVPVSMFWVTSWTVFQAKVTSTCYCSNTGQSKLQIMDGSQLSFINHFELSWNNNFRSQTTNIVARYSSLLHQAKMLTVCSRLLNERTWNESYSCLAPTVWQGTVFLKDKIFHTSNLIHSSNTENGLCKYNNLCACLLWSVAKPIPKFMTLESRRYMYIKCTAWVATTQG